MDSARAKEHAKNLWESKEMGRWSEDALFLCLRDDFCCVYRKRDFLKDRDTAYDFSDSDILNYFSHIDHLFPRSKYQALKDEATNKVLCCAPCNRRKRAWDPNATKPKREATENRPLSEEEREEFIRRTKTHLESLNQQATQFSKEKKMILKECFPDRESK